MLKSCNVLNSLNSVHTNFRNLYNLEVGYFFFHLTQI